MTDKPPTKYFEREGNSYVRTYEPPPSVKPARPPVVEKAVPEFEAVPMFAFSRPDHTRTENHFINHYLSPLGATADRIGNMILRVGDAPRLFSCHTDTVARNEGWQELQYDRDTYFLMLHPKEKRRGKVLGGDDTVGVYLMCEMIKRKIPGLYIFHTGEELGGIGSRWLAKKHPELVKGIKHAIAFDRRNYRDVITHMGGTRVCSDTFAQALANELNKGGLEYSPCTTGLFTDTRAYEQLIPECTNISVGYFDSHSSDESVDLRFLAALKHAIFKVDWDKLPVERDPKVVEPWYKGRFNYDSYGLDQTKLPIAIEGASHGTAAQPPSSPWKPEAAIVRNNGKKQATNLLKDKEKEKNKTLEELCDEYPEVAADLLEAMGYDSKAFLDYVAQCYEVLPIEV